MNTTEDNESYVAYTGALLHLEFIPREPSKNKSLMPMLLRISAHSNTGDFNTFLWDPSGGDSLGPINHPYLKQKVIVFLTITYTYVSKDICPFK